MKRPRTDTLITIRVNRQHVALRESLREMRRCGQDWRELYWSIVLQGAAAIVEVFATPLQIGWCREHRDWCNIKVCGREEIVRVSGGATRALPA